MRVVDAIKWQIGDWDSIVNILGWNWFDKKYSESGKIRRSIANELISHGGHMILIFSIVKRLWEDIRIELLQKIEIRV